MSVLSYLTTRASNAVLTPTENASIATSISTLSSRLASYFTRPGDSIADKLRFGSSTRGTILPRAMDERSDIDYMIVFQKDGFAPQTYLDRLKRFAEEKYSTSEMYQSHPTVVLELNHIKFDLVPALHKWGTYYRIPSSTTDWQDTNPNDFNTTLEAANKSSAFLLKPTIRLAKLWNASNGYVFDSYDFEKWIAGRSFYFCTNQKDYLFTVFDNLSTNQNTAWRSGKVTRAKEIIAKVRDYEAKDMPVSAEIEMKRLIPEA